VWNKRVLGLVGAIAVAIAVDAKVTRDARGRALFTGSAVLANRRRESRRAARARDHDIYFRRIKVSRARREQSAERRAHAKCVAKSVVRASEVKKSRALRVPCGGREDGKTEHPRATTNPRGPRPPPLPRAAAADRDTLLSLVRLLADHHVPCISPCPSSRARRGRARWRGRREGDVVAR